MTHATQEYYENRIAALEAEVYELTQRLYALSEKYFNCNEALGKLKD